MLGTGGSFTVLMADVDHFKSVNDQHGHAASDEALRTVAGTLRDALPDGALVGPLGGEEFGVLLPGLGLETGLQVAEHLRMQVAGTPARHGDAVLPLTASLGLAVLGPEVSDLEKLLAEADAALYQAKREGRNRVCAARTAIMEMLSRAASRLDGRLVLFAKGCPRSPVSDQLPAFIVPQ